MLPRLRILTALNVFTPRSFRHIVIAFLFWQVAFGALYVALLAAFGLLGIAPMWMHFSISFLLCAPFLSITLLLVTEHLHLSRKFRNLSEIDSLTGLRNRRSFATEALARHDPEGRDLVILLDIDHFKRVNDTYGHDKGDLCLKEVARFFEGWIRPEDVLCRYGGEEFAVFLQNTSARYAMPIARTVSAGHRFDMGGTRINISFSMGLSQWDRGQSLEDVLREADVALYQCKRDGRAQAQIYTPSTHDLFNADKGAA